MLPFLFSTPERYWYNAQCSGGNRITRLHGITTIQPRCWVRHTLKSARISHGGLSQFAQSLFYAALFREQLFALDRGRRCAFRLGIVGLSVNGRSHPLPVARIGGNFDAVLGRQSVAKFLFAIAAPNDFADCDRVGKFQLHPALSRFV